MDGTRHLWEFWMNWGVQLATAVVTLAAVLVALFGDAFRGKYFPPVLMLELANDAGEKTQLLTSLEKYRRTFTYTQDACYFHVKVSNQRRWSPATHVEIALVGVELPDAYGMFGMVWTGDLPIGWRHLPSPSPRTVGPAAYADLFSIVKGSGLHLHPVVTPLNLTVNYPKNAHIILHLQARASEVDSNALAVEIKWDGQWHDSRAEMANHLAIRHSTRSTAS